MPNSASRSCRATRIEYHMTKIAQPQGHVVVSRRGEGRRPAGRRGRSRRHDRGRMRSTMTAIDPTARIATGAVIGKDVSIGPYCVIGPNVVIERRLPAARARARHRPHDDSARARIVYPFASLGTPPQSVKYRGGPTRLVIGAELRDPRTRHHEYRHRGGRRRHRGRRRAACSWSARMSGTTATSAMTSPSPTTPRSAAMSSVGDHVFFGGLCAVHQFVRIGEGVMIGRHDRRRAATSSRSAMPAGPMPRSSGSTWSACGGGALRRDDMHRLRRA